MKFKKVVESELDYLDGITAGTTVANKAVVVDANKKVNELTITNLKLATGTSVNAVNASGVLTFIGEVVEGDTITIGADTYELDTDGTVGADNILVDLSGGSTVGATGVLTFTGAVADGETVTIGADVYEFDTAGMVVGGNIAVSVAGDTSADNAITQLLAAITLNATELVTGTSDLVADTLTISYDYLGAVGNDIATTETCVNASWGAVTLQGGVGPVLDEALTAIETAINTNGTEVVTAVKDLPNDTITVTADVAGTAGNSIATTEVCTNASWGAVTLEGGVNSTVCTDKGFWYVDNSYLYYAINTSGISDKNWRRVSLGSIF